MHKIIASAAFAAIVGTGVDANELTLQLKWTPQAQFIGYYVAEAKGFYDAEELDVTILAGGPDIAPTQVLAQGLADVIVEWMPAALAAREKGLPLVNIAQPFKNAGLRLVCLKAAGIEGPKELTGQSIGTWFEGNEYPLLTWLAQMDLGATVKLMAQDSSIDLLTQKRAACMSAMTYNEIDLLSHSSLSADDLVTFEYPAPMLEDGLYVLESDLKDANKTDQLARFLRASMQGWKYVQDHPDEAAAIALQHDPARDLARQRQMIDSVIALLGSGQGVLDQADFQKTVDTLLKPDTKPVISYPPEGAFTHAITDRVFMADQQP